MKLYITVTRINQIDQFEMETKVDPDLPWHEFIEKLNLHKYLDQHYDDWQGYDIDIDDEHVQDSRLFFKKDKLEVPEDIDD